MAAANRLVLLGRPGPQRRPADAAAAARGARRRADRRVAPTATALHPDDDPAAAAGRHRARTVERGGSVLLPSFAVGRAQALLLLLQRLKRSGAIPAHLPIFVDSPMAIEATALYRRHAALLRVPAREMKRLCDGVTLVETVQQSMRLWRSRWPAIIISASGMATGGRVLHHLKAMAPDARHHVCFPASRSAAAAARGWWPAPPRSRSTASGAGARRGQPAGQACRATPTATSLMAWLRQLRRAARRPSWCTASPMRRRAARAHRRRTRLDGARAAADGEGRGLISRSAARAATSSPPTSRPPARARRRAACACWRAAGRS
jgi:hypothetical protein